MFHSTLTIEQSDVALWEALKAEQHRQEAHLELIASENYASPAVMAAQGSIFTNKYAEGYPHKRYYGGCEHVDVAEELAIFRAKQLFSADYVNVQPHSGSQANAAVMMALLNPGDLILGMSLSHGGHLTHGSPVNFSGKLYQAISYGVSEETGLIDYETLEVLALAHRPKLIIAGFSAYSRVVDWERFRAIADASGALLMADIAHVAGLIAAGLYPSPLPYADVVTTTTHKTLRGPRGGLIMARENEAITKKLAQAVFPGMQGGPLMHVIAAKAVAFKEALEPQFKVYSKAVIDNARQLAKTLIDRGYDVVSGGTDNHLVLISLLNQTITGKTAEHALGTANITTNKNTVPGETRSPFVTSGLRLGTPAVTTRGFQVNEIEMMAHWIADILDDVENQNKIDQIRESVIELCRKFPVYGE